MADSFMDSGNGFSSNTLGKMKLGEEFLTDDVEEEYDALNDETFGGGSVDGDWEESHDKYAEMLCEMVVNKGESAETKNSEFSTFFDSSISDETQQEIVSNSISQLGLEDDLDDPAIMTVGRSRSVWPVDPLFRSSPPPPAIIDPELCGSPKTRSIWSTNHSTPSKDDVGSLFQLVSNSSKTYQPSVSPLSPCHGSVMAPLSLKAWTLEEVERKFLLSTDQSKSPVCDWNRISRPASESRPCNDERDYNGIQSSENFHSDVPNLLNLPKPPSVHSGVKTLDEVEKDLLKQRTSTVEIDSQLKSTTFPIGNIQEFDVKGVRSSKCETNLRFPSPIARPLNRGFPPFVHSGYAPMLTPRILGNPPLPIPTDSKMKESAYSPIYGRIPCPPPVFYPTSVLDPQRMNLAFIGPGRHLVRPPLWQERALKGWQSDNHSMLPLIEANGHECIQTESSMMHQSMEYDEYSGLMTQSEKEWLLRIQLMLVQAENPYVEDFYYTTFLIRKCAQEALKNKSGSKGSPKLLLPDRAKTEIKTYVPAQFENSLGKLQAVSVNFPRKVLDITLKRSNEEEEILNMTLYTQNWKKHRRLLLDIENLYNYFLEIDDEEKRILALPEDAHYIHRNNITRLTDKILSGLGCESADDTFQNIMNVRKGRNLGLRCFFEIFSKDQKIFFLRAMFRCFTSILRRDQNDLVLLKNSEPLLDFIKNLSLGDLVSLGESFENLSYTNTPESVVSSGLLRDKINIICAFKNKFGSSIICCILQQAEDIYSSGKVVDSESQARWAKVVLGVVDVICALPDMSFVPPLTPNKDLLQHFQRFAVDRDKFEILKEKVNIFQIENEEYEEL